MVLSEPEISEEKQAAKRSSNLCYPVWTPTKSHHQQKYRLVAVPGETFSGLQLMCLMYVGFKDIQPTVDVGMDLREPYEMALKLHREGDE